MIRETDPMEANVISLLTDVIHSDPEVDKVLEIVANDPYVIQAGLRPSKGSLRELFSSLLRGILYAHATYGAEAVPLSARIISDYVDESGIHGYDLLAYEPIDDLLVMSRYFCARRSLQLDDGLLYADSHIPSRRVSARDWTVLQAVEECYHRYQHRVLGIQITVTTHDRNSPIEVAARPALVRALDDLEIETF